MKRHASFCFSSVCEKKTAFKRKGEGRFESWRFWTGRVFVPHEVGKKPWADAEEGGLGGLMGDFRLSGDSRRGTRLVLGTGMDSGAEAARQLKKDTKKG